LWRETDIVFCNLYGEYIEPSNLHGWFKKLLKSAELPNIRFHDVRRFGDCKIALKGQKVRANTF
jgi:hypothetical protein